MKTTSKTARKNAPKNSHKQTVTKEAPVKKSVKQTAKKQPKENHPVQDRVYALKGFKPTVKKGIVEKLRSMAAAWKKGEMDRSKVTAAIGKAGLTWITLQQHEVHFGLKEKRS